MYKLPIDFLSEANASGSYEDAWAINSGNYKTVAAIPSEFGGFSGGFSPEDLFLQSMINCFIGTFKVYAKASKIAFTQISVTGKLMVDQGEAGKVIMKKAFLKIKVQGSDRPDRIETLVAKTFRDGFILNSVKTEIQHSLEVTF